MTGAPKPTILVVDDDESSVDIVTRVLAQKGFSMRSSTNAKKALGIVASETIDLILLDVMMPEMSGLDFCVELSKIPAASQIPVILLTACDDVPTRAAGMRLGVSEFLIKPVRKAELTQRVEGLLESRRRARAMDDTLKGM